MATEYTDSVYLLCDRNGSECDCNDSVQLVRDHNGSFCSMASEYKDSFHSTLFKILFISCNVFKDFRGEKKNVQRVLVLNLAETSKEFLIFIV